jgi:DegV family protein with EDD domain
VGKFKEVMENLISNELDILGIFISSKLSGTFQSAMQARTLIPIANKIELIDSTSTTLAMGFQVLSAAKAAADGANLKDCCHIVEKVRKNSGVFFMVDTLEFLHRGGRIGGAQRFLGTALGTKPILHMQDGKIEPLERVRTKSKAMDRLVELTIEKCHGQDNIHLAGIHANAEDESRNVLERAGQFLAPTQTMIAELSPVVGIHAGPGTIALAHMFEN